MHFFVLTFQEILCDFLKIFLNQFYSPRLLIVVTCAEVQVS